MQQKRTLIGGGGVEGFSAGFIDFQHIHRFPVFTVSFRALPEAADGGFTLSKGQTK